MVLTASLFNQLLQNFPRTEFATLLKATKSERHAGGFTATVVDGLGHGPEARQASNRAIELMTLKRHLPLDQIAIHLDTELAGTRGCALAILRYERLSRTMFSLGMCIPISTT